MKLERLNSDEEFDSLLMQFVGGGFVLGMPPAAPMYWRYMQENLEMRGKSVNFAILSYSE